MSRTFDQIDSDEATGGWEGNWSSWNADKISKWTCWADSQRYDPAAERFGQPCGKGQEQPHPSGLCERHRMLMLPSSGDHRDIKEHEHKVLELVHTHAWGSVEHSHSPLEICREPECDECEPHQNHPEGGMRNTIKMVPIPTPPVSYWQAMSNGHRPGVMPLVESSTLA